MKIAIVYHSIYGHTKLQTEAVLRGAQSVPTPIAQLYMTEEAAANLDELDAADAIILGCTPYMGSMSAGMKVSIEAAAKKNGSRSLGRIKLPAPLPTPRHFPATSSTRWLGLSSTPCNTE